MAAKKPKTPPLSGRAFDGFDVQGSNISRHLTPESLEEQAPRLAAYRLDATLMVEGTGMPDATNIAFRPRHVRGEIERTVTRDEVIEHPDGSWASHRQPPPGIGWQINLDRERPRATIMSLPMRHTTTCCVSARNALRRAILTSG